MCFNNRAMGGLLDGRGIGLEDWLVYAKSKLVQWCVIDGASSLFAKWLQTMYQLM